METSLGVTSKTPLSEDLQVVQDVIEGLAIVLVEMFPDRIQQLSLALRAIAPNERFGPKASQILLAASAEVEAIASSARVGPKH